VDLARGLLAEAGQDLFPAEVLVSSDGRSVYVGGYQRGNGSGPGSPPTYVLRRLDPRSLAVLAEREVAGLHWVQLGGTEERIDFGGLN